jgi:hypothetical protein
MRTLKWLALPLAVAALGCDTTDDKMCADGGVGCVADAGAPTPDAMMQWGLSPGMNNFKVTAVSGVTDGCEIKPGDVVNDTLPVNYVSPTISIGSVMGTPPTPSLGSGPASGNKATLTGESTVGDAAATCTWKRKVKSEMELIGHDEFTLKVTEDESMFSAGCGADVPAGGMCTSTWTWTLKK